MLPQKVIAIRQRRAKSTEIRRRETSAALQTSQPSLVPDRCIRRWATSVLFSHSPSFKEKMLTSANLTSLHFAPSQNRFLIPCSDLQMPPNDQTSHSNDSGGEDSETLAVTGDRLPSQVLRQIWVDNVGAGCGVESRARHTNGAS